MRRGGLRFSCRCVSGAVRAAQSRRRRNDRQPNVQGHRWLPRRPLRSAGGVTVRPWLSNPARETPPGFYFKCSMGWGIGGGLIETSNDLCAISTGCAVSEIARSCWKAGPELGSRNLLGVGLLQTLLQTPLPPIPGRGIRGNPDGRTRSRSTEVCRSDRPCTVARWHIEAQRQSPGVGVAPAWGKAPAPRLHHAPGGRGVRLRARTGSLSRRVHRTGRSEPPGWGVRGRDRTRLPPTAGRPPKDTC